MLYPLFSWESRCAELQGNCRHHPVEDSQRKVERVLYYESFVLEDGACPENRRAG